MTNPSTWTPNEVHLNLADKEKEENCVYEISEYFPSPPLSAKDAYTSRPGTEKSGSS